MFHTKVGVKLRKEYIKVLYKKINNNSKIQKLVQPFLCPSSFSLVLPALTTFMVILTLE